MKKKYMKPVVKKNQPLVNITFATTSSVVASSVPGTSIPVTGPSAAPAVGP